MKITLKLILAMFITILLSSFFSYLFVQTAAVKHFNDYIKKRDISQAQRLAQNLATFYELNESWENVNMLLEDVSEAAEMDFGMNPPPEPPNEDPPQRGIGSGMGQMMKNRNDDNSSRPFGLAFPMQLLEQPVALFNESGEFLYANNGATWNKEKGLPQTKPYRSAPIKAGSETIGYVLAGSMMDVLYDLHREKFLNAINGSLLLSGFISLIIGTVLVIIFLVPMTAPVRKLTEATQKIASGDYSVKVKPKTRDELGLLAANFNIMTESLNRSIEEQKRFISDSAHELRTPVTLIQGRLEMMLDGVYPASQEQLEALFEETRLLARLVQDLHVYSSLETGGFHMHLERTDIVPIISRVAQGFQIAMNRKKLSLGLDIQSNNIFVLADSERLAQVIANLLTNAQRHTPEGGKVSINLKSVKDEVQIALTDTGSGIPEGLEEAIFQRFYRVDESRNRKSGGSGLGLAISREIIKGHGGTIKALPSKEGAHFLITLPRSLS